MKLYHKKLRSVSDLEKEKARLLKKKAKLDEEPFLPEGGISGIFKGGDNEGKGIVGTLTGLIEFSNPYANLLKEIVVSRITRKKKKQEQEVIQPVAADAPMPAKPKGPSVLKK